MNFDLCLQCFICLFNKKFLVVFLKKKNLVVQHRIVRLFDVNIVKIRESCKLILLKKTFFILHFNLHTNGEENIYKTY